MDSSTNYKPYSKRVEYINILYIDKLIIKILFKNRDENVAHLNPTIIFQKTNWQNREEKFRMGN